ncbi:hypothetical protein KEM54_005602 [Ascosphaera aggregata]|nr:hypothetical protein KEM54_005602 [Ascosphaera aggregata]
MKFNSAVFVAAAGVVASAQPHGHRHAAYHARDAVEAPAAYAYKLGDRIISQEEACQGIQDGTLRWADGATPPANICHPKSAAPAVVSPAAAPSSSQPSHETPVAQAAEFFPQPSSSAIPVSSPAWTPSNTPVASPSLAATSSSAPAPAQTSTSPVTASSHASSGSSVTREMLQGSGLDRDFPDGELSCDTFPSDYGALSLDYLNLGGWSGIQAITVSNGAVSDIVTGVSGPCKEGDMCSYSCPPGYQKSQWPEMQGATGQSVGGLHCKNGKLHLTNPSLSKKLCIQGTGNVYVKNTLSEHVAVCRTDYPGTESETVPLLALPDHEEPLTCPDEATYYRWTGLPTSAQYYVNKKGVSIEEGCVWGTGEKQVGNWAPINLGVGQADGTTWISIIPNRPTTEPNLDFKIKIEGKGLSAKCHFENGMFYLNDEEQENGCTIVLS